MNRRVIARPIRLLYFIPDLHGGGAEKAVLEYLRHHDRKQFELHLVLCNERGADSGEMPRDVARHSLRKRRALDFPTLCMRLARVLERVRPQAAVSFVWYASAIHLLTGVLFPSRRPQLNVCSIDALAAVYDNERLGRTKRLLMRRLYPTSDACFGVSEAVVEDFKRHFVPGRSLPLWVQPTPFGLEDIRRKAACGGAAWPCESKRLVAVGRLAREKGFDVLLDALARLAHRAWCLCILGEGRERRPLEEQAARLGLGDRVSFVGYVDNPFPFIESADLLICPSRTEGLGRVLIEALTLGTPVIATTCPGGPADILGHGRFGTLVPADDPAALAYGIEAALENGPSREPVPRSFLRQFDASPIVAAWERRLCSLLECGVDT